MAGKPKREYDRDAMREALYRNNWRINRAAEEFDISPTTFSKWMKKYDLKDDRYDYSHAVKVFYENKFSITETSIITGIPHFRLAKYLKDIGIQKNKKIPEPETYIPDTEIDWFKVEVVYAKNYNNLQRTARVLGISFQKLRYQAIQRGIVKTPSTIELSCPECQKVFYREPHNIGRGSKLIARKTDKVFCSNRCGAKEAHRVQAKRCGRLKNDI